MMFAIPRRLHPAKHAGGHPTRVLLAWGAILVVGLMLAPLSAVHAQSSARPSTDRLFPDTTKSYFAIPDPPEFREKWEKTELGKMFADPVMEPFRKDLRRQIDEELSQTDSRLGLTWEDVQGVAGGELAVGMVQPSGDANRYAVLMVADVTGRDAEVDRLKQLVTRNLQNRKGSRKEQMIGNASVAVWTMPPTKQRPKSVNAYFTFYKNWFIASDQEDVLSGVVARIDGRANAALVEFPPYETVMQRCAQEHGSATDLRWFIEPFGYAEALRSAAGPRERGKDRIEILRQQGFQAVQGMGGLVSMLVEDNDFVHHSFVFAPKSERVLAARMLDFPNTGELDPPKWAVQSLASLLVFNWEMAKAFDASETLVNALAGSEVFDDALRDIEIDPNGLQVNIRREIIALLGQRVVMATQTEQPIGPESEKILVAFELKDPKKVEATLNRAMPRDPSVKKRVFGKQVVWEIIREENLENDPARDGFDRFGKGNDAGGNSAANAPRIFKNAALTVAFGCLVYSSDVDFLGKYVTSYSTKPPLADASDYQAVAAALNDLGAANQASFRYFVRTDQANETNYEMFRQGKMPVNESVLGQLLNWAFAPEDEGVQRKQDIDGTKLPKYSAVRQYLRPSGLFVRTESDGWLAVGCMLSRDPRRAAK